jgi:hypothetical protein
MNEYCFRFNWTQLFIYVTEHKSGEVGKQQHLIDEQFAAHPLARLWINHPGDLKPWSERRPSKLAGNFSLPRVAQHKNLGFAIYDLTRLPDVLPFVQFFAAKDAFDLIEPVENWLFVRCGSGCAGIWCSELTEPETTGPYKTAVRRAQGPRLGWTVTLGTA